MSLRNIFNTKKLGAQNNSLLESLFLTSLGSCDETLKNFEAQEPSEM